MRWVSSLAAASLFVLSSLHLPVAASNSKDLVVAWVQVDVMLQEGTAEAGYRESGHMTFVRHRMGAVNIYTVQFGRPGAHQHLVMTDIKATSSHRCTDDQGYEIGHRTFQHEVEKVDRGWLEPECRGGGRIRLLYHLPRFIIPVKECLTPRCMNARGGDVGAYWPDPDMEAGLTTWEALVAAAQGKGPNIPLELDWEHTEMVDGSEFIRRFTVRGAIKHHDWVPLEPIVN